MMVKTLRCGWCGDDPLYVRYHDCEWGVPTRDRNELFELLMLEGQQAGLSWITVLRKRRHMRGVLFGFCPELLARMGDRDFARLLGDPGVIRHRGKLEALRTNAERFLELNSDGDAADFLWSFVEGRPVINRRRTLRNVPPTTPQSDAMSRALKQKGFKFVGSTICYAFMQAAGMVNDHVTTCFRHAQCNEPGAKRHTIA
jgi:DNA-3-methyladenine glycosylase I